LTSIFLGGLSFNQLNDILKLIPNICELLNHNSISTRPSTCPNICQMIARKWNGKMNLPPASRTIVVFNRISQVAWIQARN
jgi:hypothetical protein